MPLLTEPEKANFILSKRLSSSLLKARLLSIKFSEYLGFLDPRFSVAARCM